MEAKIGRLPLKCCSPLFVHLCVLQQEMELSVIFTHSSFRNLSRGLENCHHRKRTARKGFYVVVVLMRGGTGGGEGHVMFYYT